MINLAPPEPPDEAPAEPPLLEVSGLSHWYSKRQALKGLTFGLGRGQIMGLLGPNGAGKTTCLRVLAGLLAPDRGQVRLLGEELTDAPPRLRRRIGFLPEHPPLYPEMRVHEQLRHAARLHRLPGHAITKAVGDTLGRCGLMDVRDQQVGTLSKGYRQRLGLAQAIVHGPDLIILDEPTDGLDPVQIREVRQLVQDLSSERGLILSSHVLPDIQASCDRVLILRDGECLHQGPIDAEGKNAVHVALERPPRIEQLRALAMVAEVKAQRDLTQDPAAEAASPAPARFHVDLAPGQTSSALAEALVGNGWGLAELSPARTDLERVFFETIGAEETPEVPPTASTGERQP